MTDQKPSWLVKNITLFLSVLIIVHVVVLTWFVADKYAKYARQSSKTASRTGTLDSAGTASNKNATAGLVSLTIDGNVSTDALLQASSVLGMEQQTYASAIALAEPSVVFVETTIVKSVALNTAGTTALDSASSVVLTSQKIGSGVVVDEAGFVITNFHVIQDAGVIYVTPPLSGKKRYTATVIKTDEAMDVALLKINSEEKFPPASLGDSDSLEIGDKIFAVGSPFGFEHTATHGIVSDDSRALMIGDQRYDGMIQTDAAVNRGNSGGALIDIKGHVVGITTAIYAPTGVFNGLSFAIPINKVRNVFSKVVYSN